MSAKPIIPGFLYHVRGCGLDINVVAPHGCDALCIAFNMTHKETSNV